MHFVDNRLSISFALEIFKESLRHVLCAHVCVLRLDKDIAMDHRDDHQSVIRNFN